MSRESREERGELADLLLVGPFHQALRVAIQERSLTLERLRRRIVQAGVPVALSTLSDWQQGNRRPGTERSMRVVTALEQILGLPPSSLTDLLDHESVTHDERGGAIGELLDLLPGSRDREATILNQQQKVTVNRFGAACRVWNRTLIRARRDGVDRYFLRFFGGPGTSIEDVVLTPMDNCRLGRVERHPTQPVLVAEYLFGAELRAGETWVFEHQYEDHAEEPDTEYGHGFRYMVSQYVLEVRFHAERLPAACYSYARRGLVGPPHRTGVLTMNPHHAVHLVASDVAAGVLGITWDWDASAT
ncbi:hypothetical protein DQ384_27335 [Sphaerisporangium album]|uniref:XRE family transcriptional regulator n=1 Tax=Sphaerisporangium album TaxID=509200 RepID=A0A367FAN8_9ACTN|nr:hypothetical protein [Sphaerisporangium album]RCG26999.1 hypothetical protein DQ384_27335 [Sphaerisporangium album]